MKQRKEGNTAKDLSQKNRSFTGHLSEQKRSKTMDEVKKNYSTKIEKTLSVLKEDLNTVRAGRANPAILDKIRIRERC